MSASPKEAAATLRELEQFEAQTYSQCGEDGVIRAIFDCIGTTNRFFVEFGAKNGLDLSNTACLRLQRGWTGLLMDGDPKFESELVKREFVTAENVCDLFAKYEVPERPDLLSIDIDGNDYWLWKAIDHYLPRLVIVEYNVFFGLDVSKTIAYNPEHVWDATHYHSASLAAFHKLAHEKDYALVYTDRYAPNAFFIHRPELPSGFVEPSLREVARDPWSEEPEGCMDRDWVTV
jgi:hypothetical protein